MQTRATLQPDEGSSSKPRCGAGSPWVPAARAGCHAQAATAEDVGPHNAVGSVPLRCFATAATMAIAGTRGSHRRRGAASRAAAKAAVGSGQRAGGRPPPGCRWLRPRAAGAVSAPSSTRSAVARIGAPWQRPEPPAGSGAKASWSMLTFSWVSALLQRGNSATALNVEDLLPAPGGMHAAALAEELTRGLAGSRQGQEAAAQALFRVLFGLHRRQFLYSAVLRLLNSAVQFLPPLYLSSLLAAIEHGRLWPGFSVAAALFAVLCLKTAIENQYFYHSMNTATRIRAMLQAAIYQKSLKLSEAAAAVPPVTLMQVDTGKVEELAYTAHTLWDGIFQVVGYSILLVHYLGMAGLAGLALLGACLPLNAWLQRKLSTKNRKALQASEARVTRTSEILNGIRAMRQMGWEDVFEQEVADLRELELSAQRQRDGVGAYLISYFSALPPFMIAVVLFAYVAGPRGLAGVAFLPSTIFTALAVLNQIRFPLLFYPFALNAFAEGQASLRRISEFLTLAEAPAAHSGSSVSSPLQVPSGSYSFGERSRRTLVVPEDLVIRSGELLAVVGAVGAGKTTLLRALLAELPASGLQAPSGSIAYCAQSPWIAGGTLRDIVCAGAGFEAEAFEKACSAAVIDFARPDDEISMGTLSGGQQARVAIARAVYHMGKVDEDGGLPVACVFDDVTAPLDPQVASLFVENCLFGVLQKETRIVVTSDSGQLLRRCDRVIVMEAKSEELRVRAVGTYQDLVQNGHLEAALHHLVAYAEEAAQDVDLKDARQNTPREIDSSRYGDSPAPLAPAYVTAAEERAEGAVPWRLYQRYFGFAKSPILLRVVVAAIVGTNIAMSAQQWFIGLWTSDTTLRHGLPFYLGGVVTLGLIASALTFGRTMLVASFARRSSRTVHKELCQSVLVRAQMRYFDANPTGRILQRFAKDLEQVDSGLPANLRSASACIVTLVATMLTIVLVSARFIVALGPLAWLYFRALQYYRPVARELNRLVPLARSPIYAEQAAAAAGVATIRQMRISRTMSQRAFGAIDASTAVSFAAKAVDRWFSFRMELLGNVVVFIAALLGLGASLGGALPGAWTAARAAIAITQALSVTGLLNWTVRTVAQTETSFASLQRVTFTIDKTEMEASRSLPDDATLGSRWPERGSISFDDVSVRYRADLPLVLQGVSLQVAPGQRIGIVGRTGSGKSTLLRVLLRTAELGVGDGAIRIDGVDIRHVGLARLRAALTVIPQDNFLVTGSVRSNVDPRGEHTDAEVVQALQAASLGHWSLDRHVAASGAGVSPGERQLLGVARAVLRRSRIVALDEVTSRVDEATDRKVQAALRRLPSGTTLLVVSHRLLTLEDYDTVVVMGEGRVLEVGNPRELRGRPASQFARLLAAEARGGKPQGRPASERPTELLQV